MPVWKNFLTSITDTKTRADCLTIARIMQQATKSKPKMWGSSIVGFGTYYYTYDSGREGDWFLAGFSPRRQSLTLYLMGGYAKEGELMQKLGKHKTGKSCLYFKSLDDIDLATLKKLIQQSLKRLARYQTAKRRTSQ